MNQNKLSTMYNGENGISFFAGLAYLLRDEYFNPEEPKATADSRVHYLLTTLLQEAVERSPQRGQRDLLICERLVDRRRDGARTPWDRDALHGSISDLCCVFDLKSRYEMGAINLLRPENPQVREAEFDKSYLLLTYSSSHQTLYCAPEDLHVTSFATGEAAEAAMPTAHLTRYAPAPDRLRPNGKRNGKPRVGIVGGRQVKFLEEKLTHAWALTDIWPK